MKKENENRIREIIREELVNNGLMEKPKFEVGAPYRSGRDAIFMCTSIEDDFIKGHGIGYYGEWIEVVIHPNAIHGMTKITRKEWEGYLSRYADNRYSGKSFRFVDKTPIREYDGLDFATYWERISLGYGQIYSRKGWLIMKDGVWADVVDTEKVPKGEVGKVYKLVGGVIFMCTSIENGIMKGYGFNSCGVWLENGWTFCYDHDCNLKEATEEEWKKMILKEAKDKLSKENPILKRCLKGYGNNIRLHRNSHSVFKHDEDELWWDSDSLHNDFCIYSKGKWANIASGLFRLSKKSAIDLIAQTYKLDPERIELV